MESKSLRSNLSPAHGQTYGTNNGSDHGPNHGQPEPAFCRRCDDNVRADPAGRCPSCGIFLPANPGGAAIAAGRRADLRQTMADTEAALAADLPTAPTAAQQLLIQQASRTAALAAALLSAAIKAGVGTPDGQRAAHAYLAALDRQHRALVALGIERRTQTVSPYLIIEQAVEAANQSDQDERDADASTPNGNGAGPAVEPDGIVTEAAAQAPDGGNPPANGVGVMAHILEAAEVPS